MRSNRSCTSFSVLSLIDRAPVTPFDPIAFRAAVARREGQGWRRVFQQANTFFLASRMENIRRRRSLALDGSEHDGRLMGNRDDDIRVAIPAIMRLLCACMMAAALPANASADERDIATPGSTAIAVSSTGKLPSARSSAGTSIADLWAEHIAEASRRFAIPEQWIRAVMIAESGGDAHALSPAGAMGLMQIMPATWNELRTRLRLGNDPYDPRDNILAGAAYLSELHDLYGSPGFLAAYNAGPGRYEQHLIAGDPLPAETRAYVAKIAPQTDANAAATLQITDRPACAEWSDAPLFVGRVTVQSSDNRTTDDHPFNRPSSINKINDLSALAPPSDGLFILGSGTGVSK